MSADKVDGDTRGSDTEVDVANATYETLNPLLGEIFRIEVEDGNPLEMKLIEVEEQGTPEAPEGRKPFSILFRGDKDILLPQAIYHLKHPKTGALPIFIVPVGPDEDGMRYEAVFS